MSIKNFFNFLIFGKISLGHKDLSIFEEKATDENSVRTYYSYYTRILCTVKSLLTETPLLSIAVTSQ